VAEPIRPIDVTSKAQLDLHVDGSWQLQEFSDFIAAIGRTYHLLFVVHEHLHGYSTHDSRFEGLTIGRPPKPSTRVTSRDLWRQIDSVLLMKDDARALLLPDEQIFLIGAKFSSPGFLKFFGIGQLIHKLRDLCHVAAEYERRKRELDIERSEIEIAQQKVRLIKDALELPYVLNEDEKRRVVQAVFAAMRPLERAAAARQLTDATVRAS